MRLTNPLFWFVCVLVALPVVVSGCGPKSERGTVHRDSSASTQPLSQDDWYRLASAPSQMGVESVPQAKPERALPKLGDSPAPNRADPGDALWTIVLNTTTTAILPEDRVPHYVQRVQTEGRLPGAYHKRDGEVIHFCYGRYAGPEDPAAQKDLTRVRELKAGNGYPYHGAVLMPPLDRELLGGYPDLSLAGSPEAQHADALYTVEIAIYRRPDQSPPTREDLAEFRSLAETAAINLRTDGTQAFYSHGLNSSSVTVGVFTERDFDTSQNPPYRSPTLLRTLDQFRHFSLNGEQMRVRIKDFPEDDPRAWRSEPSRVVNLPKRNIPIR